MTKIIDNAVEKSEFNPTTFVIYDQSTETTCNRLIEILPFNWYLLAANDELFILTPQTGMNCGVGSTPAIRVLLDSFQKTCLSISFDSLLDSYRLSPTTVKFNEPYDIESEVFTVISAMNILFKKHITFNPSPVKRGVEITLTPDMVLKMTAVKKQFRKTPANLSKLSNAYKQHFSKKTRLNRDRVRSSREKLNRFFEPRQNVSPQLVQTDVQQ